MAPMAKIYLEETQVPLPLKIEQRFSDDYDGVELHSDSVRMSDEGFSWISERNNICVWNYKPINGYKSHMYRELSINYSEAPIKLSNIDVCLTNENNQNKISCICVSSSGEYRFWPNIFFATSFMDSHLDVQKSSVFYVKYSKDIGFVIWLSNNSFLIVYSSGKNSLIQKQVNMGSSAFSSLAKLISSSLYSKPTLQSDQYSIVKRHFVCKDSSEKLNKFILTMDNQTMSCYIMNSDESRKNISLKSQFIVKSTEIFEMMSEDVHDKISGEISAIQILCVNFISISSYVVLLEVLFYSQVYGDTSSLKFLVKLEWKDDLNLEYAGFVHIPNEIPVGLNSSQITSSIHDSIVLFTCQQYIIAICAHEFVVLDQLYLPPKSFVMDARSSIDQDCSFFASICPNGHFEIAVQVSQQIQPRRTGNDDSFEQSHSLKISENENLNVAEEKVWKAFRMSQLCRRKECFEICKDAQRICHSSQFPLDKLLLRMCHTILDDIENFSFLINSKPSSLLAQFATKTEILKNFVKFLYDFGFIHRADLSYSENNESILLCETILLANHEKIQISSSFYNFFSRYMSYLLPKFGNLLSQYKFSSGFNNDGSSKPSEDEVKQCILSNSSNSQHLIIRMVEVFREIAEPESKFPKSLVISILYDYHASLMNAFDSLQTLAKETGFWSALHNDLCSPSFSHIKGQNCISFFSTFSIMFDPDIVFAVIKNIDLLITSCLPHLQDHCAGEISSHSVVNVAMNISVFVLNTWKRLFNLIHSVGRQIFTEVVATEAVDATFVKFRTQIISIFEKSKLTDQVLDIAYQFEDFEILANLCTKYNKTDLINECIVRFREKDFLTYLNKWRARHGLWSDIIEQTIPFSAPHDPIGKFLVNYPILNWIYHVRKENYDEASAILYSAAEKEKSLKWKKIMLSQAFLSCKIQSISSARVSQDADFRMNDTSQRLKEVYFQENLLNCLQTDYNASYMSTSEMIQKIADSPEILDKTQSGSSNFNLSTVVTLFELVKNIKFSSSIDVIQLIDQIWANILKNDDVVNRKFEHLPLDILRNSLFYSAFSLYSSHRLYDFLPMDLPRLLSHKLLAEKKNDSDFMTHVSAIHELAVRDLYPKEVN